jgi:hypothetical protein
MKTRAAASHVGLLQPVFQLAALIALTPSLLSAQAPPALPTTQQVMDHYIHAMGGHDAIFKHKSMTVHGTIQPSEKQPTFDVVAYFKDGKMLYDIALANGTHFQQGFDGKIAWQLDPKDGPQLAKGDVIKSVQRDADMYYPARILDYFNSFDVVEITSFEGHSCYHLKGTNKWGIVNEHFYDTTTGLLIGYRFNSAWRGGAGEEIEVFSDYKDFGGWLMPTRDINKTPDGTQVQTRTSVSFDDVDDSVFTLPGAVKTLLEKKAGA